ncbi:hypothetical protein chiPu_0025447 [Chiloscyllium punctatum]|uniref:Uncharacterized protein n=1 Tax=Chiloscyllium punctatum TaxID=137246 RepID=A0A401TEF0_CHIPU|nr:hypothetical protein [Chiloscyllium punctatum]
MRVGRRLLFEGRGSHDHHSTTERWAACRSDLASEDLSGEHPDPRRSPFYAAGQRMEPRHRDETETPGCVTACLRQGWRQVCGE